MRITPLVLAGTLVATGFAGSASAAKKPITKTYTATAPAPDPTNYLGTAGAASYSVCEQRVPQSYHVQSFTPPAVGKLKVQLSGFTGDWDLLLTNASNTELTYGGSSGVNTPQSPTAGDESVTIKIKKAKQKVNIIACNWAGSATGTVKYTFTYA
jgi:hypothetical protein